ncbi:MAG: aldehyde ferredoxin oxidoreductase N-terminal domain-containing protein [Candidatus Geothermincolia bacterium]
MDSMYYGETLIVDLEAGTTEQVSFDEVDEAGPGLPAGLALYEKHKDADPLVFGSGLFTGTPVPGACLGFVLGKSPLTGETAVAPLNLFAGAEMKLSGFSMVVVKGTSAKPVYLWLHDGVPDIEDASAIAGKDTWETTDGIRREMGESLIQVICVGPAGESGSDLASISINYWGSGDTFALGAVMGSKNLKAVALRGLGMLDADEPEDFYNGALELLAGAKMETGFKSLCSALGAPDLDAWLAPIAHRHRACFACTGTCATFVKYNEDPAVMESTDVEEPGMLVASAPAALWLMQGGWAPEPACRAMEAMAREGMDLVRGARELSEKPLVDGGEIKAAVKALEGSREAAWPAGEATGNGLFGPWVPPLGGADAWLAANRLGYALGICPTFLLLSGMDTSRLIEICVPAAGLETGQDEIAGMYG